MESILTSVKKMLGITEEYEHFDPDIIMHINTVFMTLTQLGVGPSDGFFIEDKTAVWSDFVQSTAHFKSEWIRTYVYLKVRLIFDPPQGSAVTESINRNIAELESRINMAAESVDYDAGRIAELEAEIERLTAEYNAEIERLNTAHAAEIERLNAVHAAVIEQLNGTHAIEIERLNAEYNAEIDRLTSEIERLEKDVQTWKKTAEDWEQKYESKTDIDPYWSDWRYFSHYNNRNDLVAKLKYSDTSRGERFDKMLYGCARLTTIPRFDIERGWSFDSMFYGCENLTELPDLNMSALATDVNGMFRGCKSLQQINFFYNWSTSGVTKFSGMFYECISLASAPKMDTRNGTNFNHMFYGCESLTDIPQLNTSRGTSFTDMFKGCYNLRNVTFTGTFNITSDIAVFTNCYYLSVDSLVSFLNALNNKSSAWCTVLIGSNNISKLTPDQIQIATNKRISLA